MMVLLLIRSIRSVKPLQVSVEYPGSPESSIDRSRTYQLRHRGGEIGVFCPFEGKWSVLQGFDGPWTHRGNWKHALDFVKRGEDGKTYRGRGLDLTDYLAFGEPVVSPIDGYVTAVCSNLADNPIGTVENQRNWGNHVIIKSLSGFYVVLAHLKKDSLKLTIGEYVTAGKQIAECGNSGYSQEPHIHLQVQYVPTPGGYTFPFHLLNFEIHGKAFFHHVPLVQDELQPLPLNVALERALGFKIGEKFQFQLYASRGRPEMVEISVHLDESRGLLFLSDGTSRIFLGRIAAQFYFFDLQGKSPSPIWDLFAAAPRIPVTYGESLEFEDFLPLLISDPLWTRWWHSLVSMLSPLYRGNPAKYKVRLDTLEIKGIAKISGRINSTFLKMDPLLGIREFQVGDRRYVRMD
jgi:murein DD-endopeptidase MepM/ murein hydrolase activator NlpD